MKKVTFFLLILLIILSANSFGQEALLDLQSYPVKVAKISRSRVKAKSESPLTVPFYDDFSKGLSFPDPNNWSDSFVFINQTYAINPPTIGVATFDAINQYGKLYDSLTILSRPADTLSSLAIDINPLVGDSIYFSFQYQVKGLGEAPENPDSLVVEFYSKDEDIWYKAWSASAHYSSESVLEYHHLSKKIVTRKSTLLSNKFFNVHIPITDDRFRKDGFKFRFINYASLPENTDVLGLRGNGDQWHIDLVYLNNGTYDDTLQYDVAYSKPIKSFLKNYESIPWKHLNSEAMQAEYTHPYNSIKIQYRTFALENDTPQVTRKFLITDFSKSQSPSEFSGGAENISPLQTVDFSQDFDYTFTSNWEDSAKYCMESYLITKIPTKYLLWNDTVKYTQQFFNYYAYDDGSAENGYGIYGDASMNGKVALKYYSYLSDSLKGILIYFNQAVPYIKIGFNLTVWSDNNGKPGSIIYQKSVYKPSITYNKDTLYRIDAPLKIGGNFWIGWVNTTTDFLNIGFDWNNIHNDKLYVNLFGTWEQSQFEGSLMIKPVFGKLTTGQTAIDKPTLNKPAEFTLFPNPTSNQISLNIAEGVQPERIRIVNLAGQIVLSKIYDNSSIDVSCLPTGIYLFQLTLRNRTTTTKKLVIIK